MHIENPGEGKLDKRAWIVKDAPRDEALALIKREHYAPYNGAPPYTFIHGLYLRAQPDILLGVAYWKSPVAAVSKSVAAHYGIDKGDVTDLSRLAIDSRCPGNSASFLIARSIKLIKKSGKYKALVSYADALRGHEGKVYQATNWDNLGLTRGEWIWGDPTTGDPNDPLTWRVEPRKKNKITRRVPEMMALGYQRIGKSYKHKYVQWLGKKAKGPKQMKRRG